MSVTKKVFLCCFLLLITVCSDDTATPSSYDEPEDSIPNNDTISNDTLQIDTVTTPEEIEPPLVPTQRPTLESWSKRKQCSEHYNLSGAIIIPAGEDIQEYVDDNPENTIFYLDSGLFSGQWIQPKNGNTFIGSEGTVLDGNGDKLYAFNSSANYVTICNIEITGYGPQVTPDASGSYSAAITSTTYDRRKAGKSHSWTVEYCSIHHNDLGGVFLGDSGKVHHNTVHHNGQIGVKLYWADTGSVIGNEIAFNNNVDEDGETKGYFNRYWEAGGTKFAWTNNLLIQNNYVHDNDGPGLWTDIDNENSVHEFNLVLNNSGIGIFHEISYAAFIRSNTVKGNGIISRGWFWEAGICIAASEDVLVYDNLVEDNYNGIVGIQQDRGEGKYGDYTLENIEVYNNIISMDDIQYTGVVQDISDETVFERSISFYNNSYTNIPEDEDCFIWDDNQITYAQWLEFHITDIVPE